LSRLAHGTQYSWLVTAARATVRTLSYRRKVSVVARRAAMLASRSPVSSAQSRPESARVVLAQITPSTDARPFLRQIRQSLDGSLLHYTDRMRLLAHADRMGIARFEANMLIATVQHSAQTQRAARAEPTPASAPHAPSAPHNSRFARIFIFTSVLLTAEFLAVRMLVHAIAGI
jgi:hypothetical protein